MSFDAERWERAKRLYAAACELSAAERQRYIEEHCGDDAGLRQEVLSLLQFHTPAEGFLEGAPALEGAPQRVGNYRLLSPLGYGGMSAVYLGVRDDGQFEKSVAIKILRVGIFGEEVSRRFHRERQLLAEFDHKHIVRLLDGGVAPDGRPYLIQDYVDGLALNEWVAQKQPDLKQRLRIFADLCEAVEYVHGRGVVHRDLKPSNILVTKNGEVKLLDFGIAKLLDNAGPSSAGTLTAQMLGTPAYASPEQVLGKKVGPASDIYALGLILYELFTGCQARPACGWHETVRFVEKESLDFGALPPPIAGMVRRCLEKEPQSRWESAAALGSSARTLLDAAAPLRARRRLAWIPVVAASLVLVGLAGFTLVPRSTPARPPAYQILGGELPSFSPDGKRMALITIPKGGGRRRLTVRDVANGEEKHYVRGQAVKWSPDGRTLTFVRAISETLAGVFLLDLESGGERELFRRPAVNQSFSSALLWTADGRAVVAPFPDGVKRSHSLWAIDIETGHRTRLTSAPAGVYGDMDAAFSSDGKRLAFVRAESGQIADAYWKDVATGPDGPVYPLTGDRRRLEGVEWLPGDKEVVFASRRDLAKSAIWKAGVAKQPLEPVLLQSEEGDCAYPAVVRSPNGGLRLAYWHRRREANLYLRDGPDYQVDRAIAKGPFERNSASLSSDGERVVFNSNEAGSFELYTTDSVGSPPFELTAMDAPYTGSGQWSPDHKRIAFESSFGANRDIFLIPALGGAPARFTTEASSEGRPSWSRDGRWIYFRSNRSGADQIWRKRSDGTGEAVQMTQGGGVDPAESMDGRMLYYHKSQGDPGIWSMPIGGSEEKKLISSVLMDQWTVTSRGILYLDRLVHAVRTPVKVYNPSDGTTRVLTSIPCTNYCILLTATPNAERLLWGAFERDVSDTRLVEIP